MAAYGGLGEEASPEAVSLSLSLSFGWSSLGDGFDLASGSLGVRFPFAFGSLSVRSRSALARLALSSPPLAPLICFDSALSMANFMPPKTAPRTASPSNGSATPAVASAATHRSE